MGERTMPAGKIRSLLAASDLGSEDEVVRTAAALVEPRGAELHLPNGLEIESLFDLARPADPGRVQQVGDLPAEQARRMAPSPRPVRAVVVQHAPEKAIEARAAEAGAGLVVIGPHRGGGVGARIP